MIILAWYLYNTLNYTQKFKRAYITSNYYKSILRTIKCYDTKYYTKII